MFFRFTVSALALSLVALLAQAAQPASPYVGQETRDIKALSPEDAGALLAGKGMAWPRRRNSTAIRVQFTCLSLPPHSRLRRSSAAKPKLCSLQWRRERSRWGKR